MATREKVQEFFAAADLENQCTILTQQITCQLGAYIAKEDEMEAKKFVACQQRMYNMVKDELYGFIVSKYMLHFTDSEIDELIAIHTSPVYKRLMSLAPTMMMEVMEFMMQNEDVFKQEMARIVQQFDDNADLSTAHITH
jgi:hypothetical protein